VLTTGKRAIVYVRVTGKEKPTFEGVEIEIGPRAGDYYIVRKGLMEGQEVVTQGNFKIDSALQILARPSMMSAEKEAAPAPLEVTAAFRERLAGLFQLYLSVQQSLSGDDAAAAQQAGGALEEAVNAMDTGSISDEARSVYSEYETSLKSAARDMAALADIQAQRERFVSLSGAMEGLVRRFGPLPHRPVRRFFCPMAFDNRGGYWLQEDETVLNPYFGAAMLRCGEMKEVLSMPGGEGGEAHDH
jgi:Cu(I)/Ag(I) efflux system membrane fusion protein